MAILALILIALQVFRVAIAASVIAANVKAQQPRWLEIIDCGTIVFLALTLLLHLKGFP